MDSTYSIDESPILISIRNCLFNGARGRDNPPGRWEKVKQLKKHHCRRRRHRRVSVFNYEFYFWDQPRCATFSCFCFCTFFFFFFFRSYYFGGVAFPPFVCAGRVLRFASVVYWQSDVEMYRNESKIRGDENVFAGYEKTTRLPIWIRQILDSILRYYVICFSILADRLLS